MKVIKMFKELTKFEVGLWLTSVGVIIASFFISGGQSFLNTLASLIGVTALIFVAKGHVSGQVLTVVFSVFYGIISYYFQYYGEMITYLCMTAPIAVLSVVSWIKHPFENSKEVRVNTLSGRLWVLLGVLTIVVTTVFFFLLSALGTANLIFSTISVSTSFIASYLTFWRSHYYALGYAANDVVLIVLWSLASMENSTYLPMIFCFVMFLFNDLYGFFNWQRMKARQAE